MGTAFTIIVYLGLVLGIKEGGNRPFYVSLFIMWSCVVIIVRNNMVQGDPLYAPLILIGAGASIAMFFIHMRRLTPR